ncbi:Uncharacterised protein [Clostridioides difficile]|uniref:hypothetical protein n=1 Tax=Clostridioides difficile TaxID=1496 RepID=UPI000D1D7A20|nr:hypothetical protein [Clostridioides difficile]UWD40698.1 hypothetical protein NYF05_15285 [Clostridioides difficile]UWD44484.1 hypothetical protein NYU56_15045 [Clostridioides difficile]VFF94734.1 Uncharacterised protein [Clostridioides difficile]VIG11058.1 Uncharacterised protein [Clostridioides difficile]HBE9438115.1 hypothetical protein [Clostridioides difficile]
MTKDMHPVSGIIKDEDGAILRLDELYKGNRVEVTQEQLQAYDISPQSGLMKNIDGEIVSIPSLIGGGNTGIIESTTRPTTYTPNKTLWVNGEMQITVDENTIQMQTVEDIYKGVHYLNGASNLVITDVKEMSDPVYGDYTFMKMKCDGINEYAQQNILIEFKEKGFFNVPVDSVCQSNNGYLAIALNNNKTKGIEIRYDSSSKKIILYLANYDEVNEYGNYSLELIEGKELQLPDSVKFRTRMNVYLNEYTNELIFSNSELGEFKLDISDVLGSTFTKFTGVVKIIARKIDETSMGSNYDTHFRPGKLDEKLLANKVTLLGHNASYDVILG